MGFRQCVNAGCSAGLIVVGSAPPAQSWEVLFRWSGDGRRLAPRGLHLFCGVAI
jgi:hypothetical protein